MTGITVRKSSVPAEVASSVTILALPVRARPEESRQSLFETGREVGKRDKAMLALSRLTPPPLPWRGAEECEPHASTQQMYGPVQRTEASTVELIP